MSISKNNFHKHEFLGRTVKVVSQPDNSWKGVCGKIVDETKNTFRLDVKGQEKVLPKKGTVLALKIGSEEITIDVSKLTFRPEDRIKKAKKQSILGIALIFQSSTILGMNNFKKQKQIKR